MGSTKIAAGDALKFLGKLTYLEKCLSLQDTRIDFRCGTLPIIFGVRVEIAYADITWLPYISCNCACDWNLYKIVNANSPHFLALFCVVDFDSTVGNFDVLLANIGVLTASSFVLTVGHMMRSWYFYLLTCFLGIIFLLNQVDELFSLLAANAEDALGLTLFCLYIHLSHLTLSLILFLKLLATTSALLGDSALPFVSAYWHLVELVWILILSTLVGV